MSRAGFVRKHWVDTHELPTPPDLVDELLAQPGVTLVKRCCAKMYATPADRIPGGYNLSCPDHGENRAFVSDKRET
jgi:hypothetical protein